MQAYHVAHFVEDFFVAIFLLTIYGVHLLYYSSRQVV